MGSAGGTNGAMTGRERFLNALLGKPVDIQPVGGPTSLATYEQMRRLGIEWPEAHRQAEPIATLAELSYTEFGYDSIMPYYSIIMGAAALGAPIDWAATPGSSTRAPARSSPVRGNPRSGRPTRG